MRKRKCIYSTVLYYWKKKITHKWTCAVQIHVIQGSTVYQNLLMPFILPFVTLITLYGSLPYKCPWDFGKAITQPRRV